MDLTFFFGSNLTLQNLQGTPQPVQSYRSKKRRKGKKVIAEPFSSHESTTVFTPHIAEGGRGFVGEKRLTAKLTD